MQDKFKEYMDELQKINMNDFSEVLDFYSKTKFHIKRIDEFLEEIKNIILSEMLKTNQKEILLKDENDKKIAGFYISERKSWEYPDSIKEIEEDLKRKQKISQLEGTALCTTTTSLTYR